MKSLSRIALVVCLLITPFAVAAEETSKEKKVRRLLSVMKVEATAEQMFDSMLGSMEESMPGGSEEFWDAFRAQVKPAELVDLIVPIYSENLDEADIDGLIAFYESPVGQKFISKQGIILEQSMEAGQQWGAKIAERAMKAMEKKAENDDGE